NQFGIAKLEVRGSGHGSLSDPSASLVDGFRPDNFYTYSKFVYAVPGDEVILNLNLPSISMIKIDVEGAELEVVEGLSLCIERHRPFILFEVLHHYLAITREELNEEIMSFREERIAKLEGTIRSKGYNIYQICGEKEIQKVKTIKPKRVADLSSADYLAVPQNEEAAFVKAIEGRRCVTNAFR
ncbi:MAG: FkbM family methyltransferase, partial [Proteobacteria bacterium]|nr:FkbM family methyltransferase [Pseudomonadota bacterium]